MTLTQKERPIKIQTILLNLKKIIKKARRGKMPNKEKTKRRNMIKVIKKKKKKKEIKKIKKKKEIKIKIKKKVIKKMINQKTVLNYTKINSKIFKFKLN